MSLDMWDPIEKKLKNWLSPLKGAETVLYLVGGAVRDREMGRPVKDMDLVCKDAKRVAEKLASVKNVAVVRFLKNPEAPCYRLVNRSDQDDHIDISELRGNRISTDLIHRDFTINAMAIPIYPDGQWGEVIDPFGGISDIQKKRIRVTRLTVFTEDPLRMLRAVRFSAELGFLLTTGTIDLIRLHASQIDQIAGERIWAELKRILQNENSRSFIRLMDELSLLPGIFPEIMAMKDCPQNAHHLLDVWPHSLSVLGYCEEMINDPAPYFCQHAELIKDHLATDDRNVLLKLATLLHDVGKPATRGYDPATDRITFYGHDKTGAGMMEEIARRLRLSKAERIYLVTMVAEHLHVLTLAMPEVKPSTRMRLFRILKDDTISLIIHGMADILATRGPAANIAYRNTYLRWANATIATFQQSIKPRFSLKNDLIRGKDLIDLGMSPGPGMGKVLSRIRNAQDNGDLQNRTAALAMAKALITATNEKTKTKKGE
jgi:poly(A) polymerase/tRNA nucleotidyltransferase (CCA-adding enzyme)